MENTNTTSIYVGNVPWKTTKEEIQMLVSSTAKVEVTDVRIIKEKGTGRSKGFAFIDIVHSNPTKFIQEAPEIQIEGRTLYFREANPKTITEKKSDEFSEQLLV